MQRIIIVNHDGTIINPFHPKNGFWKYALMFKLKKWVRGIMVKAKLMFYLDLNLMNFSLDKSNCHQLEDLD